ncbi:MAG: DNA-processing protein DprA [Truepera sp.]|nr:DNA-processing protein DprA [Truepera sp.]
MTQLEPSHPNFPAGLADWGFEQLTGLGNLELLHQPLVGVVSSRQCPARLIIAAQDWAKTARAQGLALVGGFHSPVEQEILRVVLKGTGSVVLCPARGLGGMRLTAELDRVLEAGRLLLVSPFGDGVRRADSRRAERRNRLVVALASRLLVIHAAPGGATEQLARLAASRGKALEQLPALSP